VGIIRPGEPEGLGGSGLGGCGVAHGPVGLSQFYTDLDISGCGKCGAGGSDDREAVGGAQDAGGTAIEDVGVDHGGGDVPVAK
jgi:hypothetical protein